MLSVKGLMLLGTIILRSFYLFKHTEDQMPRIKRLVLLGYIMTSFLLI